MIMKRKTLPKENCFWDSVCLLSPEPLCLTQCNIYHFQLFCIVLYLFIIFCFVLYAFSFVSNVLCCFILFCIALYCFYPLCCHTKGRWYYQWSQKKRLLLKLSFLQQRFSSLEEIYFWMETFLETPLWWWWWWWWWWRWQC